MTEMIVKWITDFGWLGEPSVDALDSGRLYAVGADVFATEPCGKGHLLAAHPRCVATPHVAWSPEETRARVIRIAADDVQAFLSGEGLNVVNP